MGSPLSPVLANFFMEKLEQQALMSAPYKPKIWFQYVDTFVIWSHGQEKLQQFLMHNNNMHENINFTTEVEANNKLAFLDVLLSRKEKLGHTVYMKLMYTDRYLHRKFNHHPCQKYGVIKTLTERAMKICEPESLEVELEHLTSPLQANGYSKHEIKKSMQTKHKTINQEQPAPKAFLP